MDLNMEKKVLKCKLVFEWKEPDVEDYLQYLTGEEKLSLEEAIKEAERYCRSRAEKTLWAADNSLPRNYDYYLKTEWSEE